MRAKDSRQSIKDLDQAVRDLLKLRPLLLDVLARDQEPLESDVPFTRMGRDPVHMSADQVCRDLQEVGEYASLALSIASGVMAVQPKKVEREQSVPNCLACGELALPRSKGGFCQTCYDGCRYFVRSKKGDRVDFIRARKAENDEVAEA